MIICFTQGNDSVKEYQWIGKINFIETRSFWHVFRSYDRMWSFYILCLQVILTVIRAYTFYIF